MNEEQIVEGLRKGSEKAMQAAIKAYGSIVKYIVIQIIGGENPGDVEECISDIFYELWMKIGGYDPSKGTLKSYLIGIAKHKALNKYRFIARDRECHVPLEEEITLNQMEPSEKVMKQFEAKEVNEVVEQMSEPERTIFIKRYFNGERIKDIAKALQLDTKFIENKLYREKAKLKKKLMERGIRL